MGINCPFFYSYQLIVCTPDRLLYFIYWNRGDNLHDLPNRSTCCAVFYLGGNRGPILWPSTNRRAIGRERKALSGDFLRFFFSFWKSQNAKYVCLFIVNHAAYFSSPQFTELSAIPLSSSVMCSFPLQFFWRACLFCCALNSRSDTDITGTGRTYSMHQPVDCVLGLQH